MFWAFAAVVLILLVTITVSNRGPVRIVGSVLLVGLLIWGLIQRLAMEPGADAAGERGKPSSPATVVEGIPLDAIAVSELELKGGGAPFELRGTIENRSAATHVWSVTILIVRRDCYEGAVDPSGCAVLWQDRHWIQVDIPPQSERKFATSFYARTGVRPARGELKNEFKLIAATGRSLSR